MEWISVIKPLQDQLKINTTEIDSGSVRVIRARSLLEQLAGGLMRQAEEPGTRNRRNAKHDITLLKSMHVTFAAGEKSWEVSVGTWWNYSEHKSRADGWTNDLPGQILAATRRALGPRGAWPFWLGGNNSMPRVTFLNPGEKLTRRRAWSVFLTWNFSFETCIRTLGAENRRIQREVPSQGRCEICSHEKRLTDCPMKNALNIGSDASSVLDEWGWHSGEQKMRQTNNIIKYGWLSFSSKRRVMVPFYRDPLRLAECAVKNNAIKSQI